MSVLLSYLVMGVINLNRGNHESEGLNRLYGFEGEVKAKYCINTFKLYLKLFYQLPLCSTVADSLGNTIFVVHGGLFKEQVSIKDLCDINRARDIPTDGPFCDALWADPQAANG